MYKKRHTALTAILLVSVLAITQNTEVRTQSQWTFTSYRDRDNSFNVEGAADNFEMEAARSIAHNNAAQGDHIPDGNSSDGDWTTTGEYQIKGPQYDGITTSTVIQDLGALNTSNSQMLITLHWVMTSILVNLDVNEMMVSKAANALREAKALLETVQKTCDELKKRGDSCCEEYCRELNEVKSLIKKAETFFSSKNYIASNNFAVEAIATLENIMECCEGGTSTEIEHPAEETSTTVEQSADEGENVKAASAPVEVKKLEFGKTESLPEDGAATDSETASSAERGLPLWLVIVIIVGGLAAVMIGYSTLKGV